MSDKRFLPARKVLQGFQSLLFPEICIMCEQEEGKICIACLKIWNQGPFRIRFQDTYAISAIPYGPQVSSVVLKAKEDRNSCARELIAHAIYRSLKDLIHYQSIDKFLLVPIPSSPQAIRRRGESFMHPILNQLLKLARSNGSEWHWQELLLHRKKVRDQAGLSSQQRRANLEGVFQLRSSIVVNLPIILVDDVVTTGSTLRNAIAPLNERKMTVLGAVTACASPHQLLIR